MRAIVLSFALTLVAATAGAQQPPAVQPTPAASKTFASAADVMALVAKAKSERKEDQGLVEERILQLAPYTVKLEYRASVAHAAVHEIEAEIFYVIDGSATLVTGGKLVNQTRTNAENLVGTAIEGGASQTVAKGDFVIVPENTPHWFSAVHGVLILMALHVPRPVPAAH